MVGFEEEGRDCIGGEGVGDDEVVIMVEGGELGGGEVWGGGCYGCWMDENVEERGEI